SAGLLAARSPRQPAVPRHASADRRGPPGTRPSGDQGSEQMIGLTVNGVAYQLEAEPGTPLLYVLRNDIGLNGAKFGCGLGQCGACTVLLDDKPVYACLLPLAAVQGRKVRTLEGLGKDGKPGPL